MYIRPLLMFNILGKLERVLNCFSRKLFVFYSVNLRIGFFQEVQVGPQNNPLKFSFG